MNTNTKQVIKDNNDDIIEDIGGNITRSYVPINKDGDHSRRKNIIPSIISGSTSNSISTTYNFVKKSSNIVANISAPAPPLPNIITKQTDELPEDEDLSPTVDLPNEYFIGEPGLILIFNHINIPGSSIRLGTEKDVNFLKECFQTVFNNHVIIQHEKSKDEIRQKLTEIAHDEAHTNKSFLAVIFLTHGNVQGTLYTSCGRTITTKDIWEAFSFEECIWQGKPKFFIFQACKGEDISMLKTGIQMDIGTKNIYTPPVEADILIAYSTVEGNASLRDPSKGSWFIQELCKFMLIHGKEEDVVSILTRVSNSIAHNYQITGQELDHCPVHLQNSIIKQMPCFISTLTKKFYISRSNTRVLMKRFIGMQKDIEIINENIKKLMMKILQAEK